MGGGGAVFGSILSLSNDSGTIVFVSVMLFLTFFEGLLHYLEKAGGKMGYRLLIMKLYREFMILGFISFAIELISNITSLPQNDKWYEAFNFAHIVILFVGITFLFQSVLLVSLIAQRNKRLLYYDACTSESLFVEYIELNNATASSNLFSLSRWKKYLFDYGLVSVPLPELREKIEFKIIQEYFIRSYQLDPKFKFANYMCKVLKNYIISLVEVRPINWIRVAFLVGLNYVRILVIDPIFEASVCEDKPSTEYVTEKSETYGEHVCAEYQLRVIFIGITGVMIFFIVVFSMSELYVQRLIGKVLDDEETLQWLDTEEAAHHHHESPHHETRSAFPHPFELLNPNETLFKKTPSVGGSNLSAAADFPHPSELLPPPPIVPAVGAAPRFGSAAQAEDPTTSAELAKNRRASIRRSFSYKSPLNDPAVDSPAPLHESPIPAPPRRGLKERRQSIVIHVPIHRESLPEHSRGSLVSSDETGMQALTTEVNSWNRRHLYLKCLERIIHIEYTYHETEARRTSVASEEEFFHGVGGGSDHRHHQEGSERGKHGSLLSRHNSGRLRANTFGTAPSLAALTPSKPSSVISAGGGGGTVEGGEGTGGAETGSGIDRIQMMKSMKLKTVREIMKKSKSIEGPEGGEGGPLSPSGPLRQNSGGSMGFGSPFKGLGGSSSSRRRASMFTGSTSSVTSNTTAGPPSEKEKEEATLSRSRVPTFSLAGIFDPVSAPNSPSPTSGEGKPQHFHDNPMGSKKHSSKPPLPSSSSASNNNNNTTNSSQNSNNKTSSSAAAPSKSVEMTAMVKQSAAPASSAAISAPVTRKVSREYTAKFFEFVSPSSATTNSTNNPQGEYSAMTVTHDTSEEGAPPSSASHCCSPEVRRGVRGCFSYLYGKIGQLLHYLFDLFIKGGSGGDHHNHHEGEEGEGGHKKLTNSTSALEDIKELQADLKAIFAWRNPFYYYVLVEFTLLLQCMYVALWATNFVILANESNHVVFWQIGLLLPMMINFFFLKQIIFIACLLQSIIKLDTSIANKISEEAIEERNVTQRLRRMIRDRLKEINPDKKMWKSLLYSFYREVMDENEEITRKEWKEFLYSLTLQLTNNSTRQLFKVLDQDQDGYINWEDLYIIVFPDFLKKKLKIRKKHAKKSSSSRHGSRGNASEAHYEGGEREGQFSVEYQISDEDAQAYKKKSQTARSSVLSTSMRMIRTSLVPLTPSAYRLSVVVPPGEGKSPAHHLSVDHTAAARGESKEEEQIASSTHRSETILSSHPPPPPHEQQLRSRTESKELKSILKSSSTEKLSIDLDVIRQNKEGAAAGGGDDLLYSVTPKATSTKKASVSFDDVNAGGSHLPLPPPATTTAVTAPPPLPPPSSSSLARLWPAEPEEDDEEVQFQEMRERSRTIARQRSESHHSHGSSGSGHHNHPPHSGRGGGAGRGGVAMMKSPSVREMMGALKRTFTPQQLSMNEDDEDEEEEEDDFEDDDEGRGKGLRRSPPPRFPPPHTLHRPPPSDDDDEDAEERSRAGSAVDESLSEVGSSASEASDVSQLSDGVSQDESLRQSLRHMSIEQRRAVLGFSEDAEGEDEQLPIQVDRKDTSKSGQFFDV